MLAIVTWMAVMRLITPQLVCLTGVSMMDIFRRNGAMASSFKVFVVPPLVQSMKCALTVWQAGLHLLVELQQWSPFVKFFGVRQTTIFCIIQLKGICLLSCNCYNTQSISGDYIFAYANKKNKKIARALMHKRGVADAQ